MYNCKDWTIIFQKVGCVGLQNWVIAVIINELVPCV